MSRLNRLYIALSDIIIKYHQLKCGSPVVSSEVKGLEEIEGFEQISFLTTEQTEMRSNLSELIENIASINPKRSSLLNYTLYIIQLIKPLVLPPQFIEPDVAIEKQNQISQFIIHMCELLQIQAPNYLHVKYDKKSYPITGLKNNLLDGGGYLSDSGKIIQDKLFESLFRFLPAFTTLSEDFIKQTIQDVFVEHQYNCLLSQHQALLEANEALRQANRTRIQGPLIRPFGIGFFSSLWQMLPTDSAVTKPVLEGEYETNCLNPDFDSF